MHTCTKKKKKKESYVGCLAPASWSHPFLAPRAALSTGPVPDSESVHATRAEDTHFFFSNAQLKQEEAEVQEQWAGRLGAR